MKVDIFKAEIYGNNPSLGVGYYGQEEFLGAYKTDDKMYMVVRNKEGQLCQREFFQDYSVTEGANGLPQISSTTFATFDAVVLEGRMKDHIEEALKGYNKYKEEFDAKNLTFVDLIPFAKNSVQLNDTTLQCLEEEAYRYVENIHKNNPYMSIYQAISKIQMEQTIESLTQENLKSY